LTRADKEHDKLRREAEDLGVEVDGRWGVDRLRAEIDAAKADPDPEDDDPNADPEDDAVFDEEREHPGTGEEMTPVEGDTLEPEPAQVHRAGGWVDYGDGRGWVLGDPDAAQAGPPEPVKAGPGGLPGHPVIGTAAGWAATGESEAG
jgi:hypothetical protein